MLLHFILNFQYFCSSNPFCQPFIARSFFNSPSSSSSCSISVFSSQKMFCTQHMHHIAWKYSFASVIAFNSAISSFQPQWDIVTENRSPYNSQSIVENWETTIQRISALPFGKFADLLRNTFTSIIFYVSLEIPPEYNKKRVTYATGALLFILDANSVITPEFSLLEVIRNYGRK